MEIKDDLAAMISIASGLSFKTESKLSDDGKTYIHTFTTEDPIAVCLDGDKIRIFVGKK